MRTKILKDNEGNFIPLSHTKSTQTSDNRVLDDVLEELKTDYDNKIHSSIKTRLLQDLGVIRNELNNANMLPYESQYITANNSFKGVTNDNVVKGKTIQNVVKDINITTSTTLTTTSTTNVVLQSFTLVNNPQLMKPNTTYTAIFNYVESSNTFANMYAQLNIRKTDGTLTQTFYKTISSIKAIPVFTFQTPSDFSYLDHFFLGGANGTCVINKLQLLILEGDYTNQPIPPYFEGIRSVNEDTETMYEVSCGKNLCQMDYSRLPYSSQGIVVTKGEGNEIIVNGTTQLYPFVVVSKKVKLKPNTKYYLSCQTNTGVSIRLISRKPSIVQVSVDNLVLSNPLLTDNIYRDDWILEVATTPSTYTNFKISNIQIEEGTTPTTYEPYTEHRLPIKMKNLRSLPNGVCDTSDGVRRVGKVVLDGSESWKDWGGTNVYPNTLTFSVASIMQGTTAFSETKQISSAFRCYQAPSSLNNVDLEGIATHTAIYVRVNKSRLATQDVAGFKTWLASNNVTVYYELATPTTEEGNTEELITYNGKTNIFTEGSLIEPNISVKVPSDVQQMIMSLSLENENLKNEAEDNNLNNLETNVNQEARLTALELGVMY